MKRTKKFFALALLLSALITVGCGNGGEQEAAAETGTGTTEADASETIGAGAGENTELDIPEAGTGDAESAGESDGTENAEGKRVSSNKDMYIFLTNLELDSSEGTAYLHIVNRTEDRTISIEMDEVWIDGREGGWQSDGITLAGGETGDMTVHFSRPNSGDDLQELSECAYIRFGAAAPGLYGKEDAHVSFYVKGDKETAEEIDKTMDKTKVEVYVEEQELYSKDGVVITLNQLVDERGGGVSLLFESTINGAPFNPSLKELYIGSTLIERDNFEQIYEVPKSGILISEEKFKQIKEELPEISVVFEYRAEAGGELLQTPKLSFPVLSR